MLDKNVFISDTKWVYWDKKLFYLRLKWFYVDKHSCYLHYIYIFILHLNGSSLNTNGFMLVKDSFNVDKK